MTMIDRRLHTTLAGLVLWIGVMSLALAPTEAKAQDSLGEATQTIHKSGYVQVNGGKLYYEARGSKAAAKRFPPVILVHGLSLDNRMWDRQFSVLSKFFLTYRYDMRGHGRSDPVTGPVGLHDDLVSFMDALGIDRAHLVGQSLGGNAVSEVAATHPHRVEKIVLIDSGINGFQYPTPNVLQRIPTYLDIDKQQGRPAALSAWVRDPLFSTSYQDREVRPLLERIVLGCSCSLFFNPQFQIRPPTFSRLGQIAARALVLIGERDENEFQAASAALDEHIPDSTKVVIPGAGHMANMDRPRPVTFETLRFLLSRR
jgi:pimeloyl-ACP methyl ester carboxylesterase